jgi:hypothetical protein
MLVQAVALTMNLNLPLEPFPPHTPSSGPSALWVTDERGDHLYYDPTASFYQIRQYICHELGHILMGHVQLPETLLHELAPNFDLGILKNTLGLARHRYTTAAEKDAETFASLAQHKLDRRPCADTASASARLDDIFGAGRRDA